MNGLITIVTDSNDFYKQVMQILSKEAADGKIECLKPGCSLNHAKMIVTDGSDQTVYEEDIPTFVITENFPASVRESASVRFYKRGNFSPDVFAKDVSEWAEIIEALEDSAKNTRLAEKTADEFKKKLSECRADMQMAGILQKEVMTPKAPDGFDIFVCYQSESSVSGDILVMGEAGDKVFAVVGDVTDHGYLAGLYGASLYSLIKSYLVLASQFEIKLEELVRYVQYASGFYQSEGYGTLRQKTSATMLFCEIDKKKNVARFVNCGHGNEPPIIVNKEGDAAFVSFIEKPGAILPAIGDFTVIAPSDAAEVFFEPGSCVVLYTDGITEVFKNPDKKDIADEYSTKRLLASVNQETHKKDWTVASVAEGIKKDVKSYSISSEFHATDDMLDGITDDVTMLVLKWEDRDGK